MQIKLDGELFSRIVRYTHFSTSYIKFKLLVSHAGKTVRCELEPHVVSFVAT